MTDARHDGDLDPGRELDAMLARWEAEREGLYETDTWLEDLRPEPEPARPPVALHQSLVAPPAHGPDPWRTSPPYRQPDRGEPDYDDPGLLTHRAMFDPDGSDPDGFDSHGHPFDRRARQYDFPPPPNLPPRPHREPYPGLGDYPPSGPRRGRHRPAAFPRPRWLVVLGWVGAIVGLLVVSIGALGVYQYRKLSGNIQRIDALAPDDPSIKDAAKQRDAENFLLIGSDTRANGNGEDTGGYVTGQRSDTTILAHLSPSRDKALLVSFPRDSWVDIPACRRADGTTSQPTKAMFNSAFETGGARCTVLTVQKLTGISVNHYVQVDFTGFRTMVDALGGVTICSRESVYDRYSGLRLREGNQKLKGTQALAYVRARKSIGDGSDISRIQRQQRFLGAMIREATSSKLLFNPLALTRFLDAATKSLTLDKATSFGDLKGLADQLRDLDPKRVTFLTAPIADQDYTPPGTNYRGRVLLDDVAGRRLWDSIINDKPAPPKAAPSGSKPKLTVSVPPEEVSVRVLNGVGVDGLARRTAAELTSVGFAVTNTGNGPFGTTASVVRHAPNRLDAARTLATAVPGAVLQEDAGMGRTVELVVGSTYTAAVPVHVGEPVKAGTARTTAPATTPRQSRSPLPSINAADRTCG